VSRTRYRTHTTTEGRTGRRSPTTEQVAARRLSSRMISDAVVAGYLHDISQRRRRSALAPKNHLLRPTPER
jgi:hypothetical protein